MEKQGKVKQDLVDRLHVRLGVTKTLSAQMVDALVDEVISMVAEGHSVTLSGFGVFEQRIRRDRMGTNPQTREKMVIPGGVFPSFRPGKRFCREVQK